MVYPQRQWGSRISKPDDCALLDLSVLQSWPTESLAELAEQASLVVVPPCLIGDIIAIQDRERRRSLLTKLLSFECAITISIRDHLLFELLEQEPSGLLLVQRADLLLPERTAGAVFETLLNSSQQTQSAIAPIPWARLAPGVSFSNKCGAGHEHGGWQTHIEGAIIRVGRLPVRERGYEEFRDCISP